MQRFIRAILFDLGGTLMYARDPWSPIQIRADLVFAETLRTLGVEIEPAEFAQSFRKRLNEYYIRREQNLFETTYSSVAHELLREHGYSNLSEASIRTALDALFAVTQSNWVLEPDAMSTLKILENNGYRMGLVSNAGDDKDVLQLAEKFRIESFFDFILTSAMCSYRKPHPRIFEVAIGHWNIPASEIAMVGDTLEADILGANNKGLFSIWISRRASPKVDHLESIQPNLSLPALEGIPSALAGLR